MWVRIIGGYLQYVFSRNTDCLWPVDTGTMHRTDVTRRLSRKSPTETEMEKR